VKNKPVDISVVYLTKNGGNVFKNSLRAVFKQKIDQIFEVICVDSGSTDSTLDLVSSYPIALYQIKPEDFSFGPARDYGFSKAEGNIIVTLSQDVVPCDEKWLYNLTKAFESPDVSVVQGHDIRPDRKEIFFWERSGQFYFTRETRKWVRQHGVGLSCSNLAIRNMVWRDCLFGETPMSEDKALQAKLHAKGHKIFYAREATAYHGHSYCLGSLIKRCENEGLGWRYVNINYSFLDMAYDILSPRKYITLMKGIFQKKIVSSSEFLFPFIRPLWLFKGNHFTKRYRF